MQYPALALSLLLILPLEAAASLIIHGEARSIEQRELIYTEDHLVTEGRHDVSYRFPDGSILADKNMDYEQGYQTPSFQLYDHRFSRQSGSKWQAGKWLLWQQEQSGDREEKTLEARSDLVIDAGFNYFVTDHFVELSAGKNLEFTFAITDPPMGIDMRIGAVDCADISFNNTDKPHLCLKAVSRNPLLRWFVPDIYLAYVKEVQVPVPLLVLYQGPSNLPDNKDRAQKVRIEYRYELSPPVIP